MNNLIRLQNTVRNIRRLAGKANGNSTGALRGTMIDAKHVRIGSKTYNAQIATQVQATAGACVWCQLADGDIAVVIGG